MTVDITARFIAPLLEFTSQELLFRVYQVTPCTYKSVLGICMPLASCMMLYYSCIIITLHVHGITLLQPPGSRLTQHRHELGVRNVSPLTVTAVLMCGYPFSLLSRNTPLAQLVRDQTITDPALGLFTCTCYFIPCFQHASSFTYMHCITTRLCSYVYSLYRCTYTGNEAESRRGLADHCAV